MEPWSNFDRGRAPSYRWNESPTSVFNSRMCTYASSPCMDSFDGLRLGPELERHRIKSIKPVYITATIRSAMAIPVVARADHMLYNLIQLTCHREVKERT